MRPSSFLSGVSSRWFTQLPSSSMSNAVKLISRVSVLRPTSTSSAEPGRRLYAVAKASTRTCRRVSSEMFFSAANILMASFMSRLLMTGMTPGRCRCRRGCRFRYRFLDLVLHQDLRDRRYDQENHRFLAQSLPWKRPNCSCHWTLMYQ